MEFLLERNKEMYLDYFNLSNKKFMKRRLKITLIISFLYVVVLYMYPNPLLIVATPLVVLLGYKLPYIELLRLKDQEDIVKQHMFPLFLRYFISLIETQGNVYQTIRATIPYMQDPLRSEIIELIKKLDSVNVSSHDAFIEFAEYIGSSEAHMIMGVISQFYEEGIQKSELVELERTIKDLQENKVNEMIDYQVNSVDKHADPILFYGLGYVITFVIVVFVAYFKDLPL